MGNQEGENLVRDGDVKAAGHHLHIEERAEES